MNKKFCLFLTFAFFPYAQAYANSEISGLWGGIGIQSSSSAWIIKMNFSNDEYLIDYPTIPCGGHLDLLEVTDNETYTFRERITENISNCTNNGTLRVNLIDQDTMNWEWYYPSGRKGIFTQLKRYEGEKEFNEEVPNVLNEHLSERYERSCDNYYPGRTGVINSRGLLSTDDQYVVRYVNNERKMITIEGTEGGNSLNYGEYRELSCSELNRLSK